MKKKLFAIVLASIALAGSAFAQTATDYGAILNTNLDTINDIWGIIATIMVGVALVTVGVRFFYKAR